MVDVTYDSPSDSIDYRFRFSRLSLAPLDVELKDLVIRRVAPPLKSWKLATDREWLIGYMAEELRTSARQIIARSPFPDRFRSLYRNLVDIGIEHLRRDGRVLPELVAGTRHAEPSQACPPGD
jgi:hypothetical protein